MLFDLPIQEPGRRCKKFQTRALHDIRNTGDRYGEVQADVAVAYVA
jgi:hypothetical protein